MVKDAPEQLDHFQRRGRLRHIFLLGVMVLFISTLNQNHYAIAATVPNNPINSGKHILLSERSFVTIRTHLGELACNQGELVLSQPKLKLVKASVGSKNETKQAISANHLAFYSETTQVEVIGPYEAGTEIVLEIKPWTPYCRGRNWKSNDLYHSRLTDNGGGSFTIRWEDSDKPEDADFNDLFTDVTVQPEKVAAGLAYSADPHYQLPWPLGVKHIVTVTPGQKGTEHEHTSAYDIDMNPKRGDVVVAAEEGTILWIEDSFGSGGCPDPSDKAAVNYWRGRANVVVIQTEADVNTTYVHLLQDSVSKLNLRIGNHVKKGQTIGQADSSGYSCGSHLHFEWQHHCYDVDRAKKWREGTIDQKPVYPVGKPSLMWSCPNYPPPAPFKFLVSEKEINLQGSSYTSDNQPP